MFAMPCVSYIMCPICRCHSGPFEEDEGTSISGLSDCRRLPSWPEVVSIHFMGHELTHDGPIRRNCDGSS